MSQATHTNITRRSILAGLGASIPAAAVAVAPTFAGSNPDAELLDLIRQWQEADAAYKAQLDPLEAAEKRYYSMRPEMPEALKKTENDVRLGLSAPLHQTASLTFQPEVFNTWRGKQKKRPVDYPVTEADRKQFGYPEDAHTIRRMEPWPEAQTRADEIIKTWDGWQAGIARANRESGLAAAEAEHDRLLEIESAIRKQIALMSAQSNLGIMLKARVAGILWGGLEELEMDLAAELDERATNETMAWSVVRDLLRLSLSAA